MRPPCLFSLLILGATAAAQAPAAPAPVMPTAPHASDAVPDVMVSDQLFGAPVQAETGETLGSVEDVMVDTSSGRILALAVKPAPALRNDGQLTAVPVEALAPATPTDAANPQPVVRVRREAAAQLRDAPAFAREQWNDALTADWLARLREHFAVKASEATVPAPMRLSSLVGTDVVDPDQAAVGRVNALAVDLGRREISAAIVTPVEDLGSRDRLMPVPFSALRPVQARAQAARTAAAAPPRPSLALGVKLERLLQAPRFNRGDLPRLRAMLAGNDVRAFYAAGAEPRTAGTERGGTQPTRPAAGSTGKEHPEGGRPSTPKSDSGTARGSGRPRAP
jgi:sporulation protein YlmC with PRC-barrel domain